MEFLYVHVWYRRCALPKNISDISTADGINQLSITQSKGFRALEGNIRGRGEGESAIFELERAGPVYSDKIGVFSTYSHRPGLAGKWRGAR